MGIYSVRYVHKISPKATDTHADITLSGGAFSNRNTLGAALRKAGVLSAGVALESFRVEGDKVVAFPRGSVWHSVILTLEALEQGEQDFDDHNFGNAAF